MVVLKPKMGEKVGNQFGSHWHKLWLFTIGYRQCNIEYFYVSTPCVAITLSANLFKMACIQFSKFLILNPQRLKQP